MNYYKHNIGDYRRDTNHLSLLEHGIFRQMLDQYYLDEKPLNTDINKLMRSLNIRTPDERESFDLVLADFFVLTDDGYTHKRCERDLIVIYEKSEKARASAKCRWNKGVDANADKTDSERNANGMLPITDNLLPTKNPKSKNKFSDDDLKLAEWFLLELKNDIPNIKQPVIDNWANTFRLMRERDKRTHRQMAELIKWSRADNFWSGNILSPNKLREKFDQLTARMKGDKNGKYNQAHAKPTGCQILEENDRAAEEWLNMVNGSQDEDDNPMERIINPV